MTATIEAGATYSVARTYANLPAGTLVTATGAPVKMSARWYVPIALPDGSEAALPVADLWGPVASATGSVR